jgi:MoxR-like ATPase
MSRSNAINVASMPEAAALEPAPRHDPFRGLGLYGLGRIAPVLIAALVTEEPLLLIGPHGTAKTLLLMRIASALGLVCRHYNASLLNFDDLVGFPLPDEKGGLRYVGTPASIWGAGAVIIDEISRCRPDIQNKLFPIIHERRAQGLLLEGLRYRWSAMNPPARDEDEGEAYRGSEPLDPALADRFAYILEMPGWERLGEADRTAIVVANDDPVPAEAAKALAWTVAQARALLPVVTATIGGGIADYVRILVDLLRQAHFNLSPRRASMLYRSALATHAASLALDPGCTPPESVLLAVTAGLPQRAQGIALPDVKILSAHKEAWRLANLKAGDPMLAILTAADPVQRLRLSVAAAAINRTDFSGIVADVLAQLPDGAREAGIAHLFETGAVGRLTAAIAEQAGTAYRSLATPSAFSEALHAQDSRFTTWQRIKDLLSRLDPAEPRHALQANALVSLFVRRKVTTPHDAEAAFNAFAGTDLLLRGEASRDTP